jgi:hypothetical protein
VYGNKSENTSLKEKKRKSRKKIFCAENLREKIEFSSVTNPPPT